MKRVISFEKHNLDFEETHAYSVGELLSSFYIVECLSSVRGDFRFQLDSGAIERISSTFL